jgi:hypothetical protein
VPLVAVAHRRPTGQTVPAGANRSRCGRPNHCIAFNAYNIRQIALRKCLAKFACIAVARVGEDDVPSHSRFERRVEEVERDLPLLSEGHLVGNPDFSTASGVICPRLRQVQTQPDAAAGSLSSQMEARRHLAVVDAP